MENSHYRTSDSALATYLILKGYSINLIDYTQPRFDYVFNGEVSSIQEQVTIYLSGNALVDPSGFFKINRRLMRVVKSQSQWGDAI